MNYIFYIISLGLIFNASLTDISVRKIPDSVNLLLIVNWAGYFIVNTIQQGAITLKCLNAFCFCFITAAAIYFISFIFKRITGRKAFGGGDIKLIFSSGLLLYLSEYIEMLFIAFLIAFVYGIFLKEQVRLSHNGMLFNKTRQHTGVCWLFAKRSFRGVPFAPGILGGYVFVLLNRMW